MLLHASDRLKYDSKYLFKTESNSTNNYNSRLVAATVVDLLSWCLIHSHITMLLTYIHQVEICP